VTALLGAPRWADRHRPIYEVRLSLVKHFGRLISQQRQHEDEKVRERFREFARRRLDA
jgi:hypothetical protein